MLGSRSGADGKEGMPPKGDFGRGSRGSSPPYRSMSSSSLASFSSRRDPRLGGRDLEVSWGDGSMKVKEDRGVFCTCVFSAVVWSTDCDIRLVTDDDGNDKNVVSLCILKILGLLLYLYPAKLSSG